MLHRIKYWLIKRLGGYTRSEYELNGLMMYHRGWQDKADAGRWENTFVEVTV